MTEKMLTALLEDAENFDENDFRTQLITAQYQLRESVQVSRPHGLLILVNGVELSGKGEAVATLREWLDPRLLKVTYLETQYPSENMPIWQRHSYPLPRHGEITVMFGNWYADLLYAHTKNKLNKQQLEQHLKHIHEFEQDLCANNTRVVKCWFDLSANALDKRLNDNKADPHHLYKIDWTNEKQLKKFRQAQDYLFDQTKMATQVPQWQVINGDDRKTASIEFCQLILNELNAPLHQRSRAKRPFPKSDIPDILQNPANDKIAKEQYKAELKDKQKQLASLIREYQLSLTQTDKKPKNKPPKNIVMVFEGMDAAGKGGSIKRIVSALDPREYQIHNIAAPEKHELEHPYLWRFWHRLPVDGGLGIFDRSWYGRVLVERIEAFAKQSAWQEAYDEINRFEQHLVDKDVIVLKFWLAIGMDTQLERFKERENTPHKRFKITPDDWRNRDRWEDYVQAAADMLERTSTEKAPWHIIATNDKYTARLQVLQTCIDTLKSAL